jgi:uncharacterized membrane protein
MAQPEEDLAALRAQVAALTARVYQLEQARVRAPSSGSAEAVPPAPTSQPAISAPAISATHISSPPTGTPRPTPPWPEESKGGTSGRIGPATLPAVMPAPHSRSIEREAEGDLEKKIGQYWLNRIGIAAMLIGVSYFLKYAFENNWIGPGGRITIGLLAGIGLVLWSERFRARGYGAFSYSLKAVGIGALYLSLWGAFQVYHLIPSSAAFVAMMVVTASTICLALSQDAELLASFAMIGGFATPILLSTGQNHEAILFSYVALLDAAILVMAMVKPWRRLLWGSFAGTIILYLGWYGSYYNRSQRPVTVFFAALFAAIFAAVPLVTRHERSTRFSGPSITLTMLPVLNAGLFFLGLYFMYYGESGTLTWYALVLAAIYLAIGGAFKKRFPGEDTTVLNSLHVSIAVAFLTIAIPLKLDTQWISIGWLIESAVLLWVSVRTHTNLLRYLAVAALGLGIFRLLIYDQFRTETLFFNARFATYLVAIAVLAGITIFGKKHASEQERPFLQLASVAINVLALIALSWEVADYFDRQMAMVRADLIPLSRGHAPPLNYYTKYHEIAVLRGFTYSAIWLIYGAVLMAVGFRTGSALVRWQALILIACATIKIFLYDVSQLGGGYRILSFIGLGAVLLGISFIYQGDWLELSPRSLDDAASPNASPKGAL